MTAREARDIIQHVEAFRDRLTAEELEVWEEVKYEVENYPPVSPGTAETLLDARARVAGLSFTGAGLSRMPKRFT
jgi:hypothetical protein